MAMELTVAIDGGEDSDEAEVDELTRQLRRQLLELDVDNVEALRDGDVPAGAKPVDPATLGALVVSLGPGVLQAVVGFIERWTKGRPVRSVKMTIDGDSIELSGATPEEQRDLLQLFVARHAAE